jgi:hypothetical protein
MHIIDERRKVTAALKCIALMLPMTSKGVAVFGRAAGSSNDLTRTIETRCVKQTKVVAELVGVDVELVVTVAPRLAKVDVSEAGPPQSARRGKT